MSCLSPTAHPLLRRACRSVFLACYMMLLFAATPQASFAQGCPWCTSPTTCRAIEEDTDLNKCWIEGSGGGQGICQFEEGDCTYQVLLDSPLRKRLLAENGIVYKGTETVEVSGIQVEGILIDEGYWAIWGCSGELQVLMRRNGEEEWQILSPAAYPRRYSLRLNAATNP